jgi:hypothetical protein
MKLTRVGHDFHVARSDDCPGAASGRPRLNGLVPAPATPAGTARAAAALGGCSPYAAKARGRVAAESMWVGSGLLALDHPAVAAEGVNGVESFTDGSLASRPARVSRPYLPYRRSRLRLSDLGRSFFAPRLEESEAVRVHDGLKPAVSIELAKEPANVVARSVRRDAKPLRDL